jgi:predicted AAA+ superfamily ATPase
MYPRFIQIPEIIKTKSLFLVGPRMTGKSTLLREALPKALYLDLLDADLFRRLSARPDYLRELVKDQQKIVVIDEVQKLPEILDEVQRLIDSNRELRFALTGSSARKLKRGAANLLGGRALFLNLHPLVSAELGHGSRILDRLNRGSLPALIDSEYYERELSAYVGVYLREEIQAEGLTRSIGNFGRVLETAALCNGQQVNFTQIGNDAQVPPRTVSDYFQLFEDTLIGSVLPSFRGTKSRKAVATPKFYFFDTGVARVLSRTGQIQLGSKAFGDALEHLIFLELKAYVDYTFSNARLSYWRSESQLEVDFVIDDKIAIEVKGTNTVTTSHLKGLKALGEDFPHMEKFLVAMEPQPRNIDGITIIHVDAFLKKLWNGEIF